MKLTFKKSTTLSERNLIINKFLYELDNAQNIIHYIVIVESIQNSKYTPRYHILLANVKKECAYVLKNYLSELNNICNVIIYDKPIGINFYLKRHIKTYIKDIQYSKLLKQFLIIRRQLCEQDDLIAQIEKELFVIEKTPALVSDR